jgi:hypothetical protein
VFGNRQIWVPVKTWENLPGWGNLYVLARMLDPSGCGHAWLPINWAVDQLGLKRRTVIDYVRRCNQYGLFRKTRWRGDWVHVYYSSIAKVACHYSGPGGCRVLVGPEHLKFKKAIIPEAIVKAKQQQSFWKQREEQKATQGTRKPQMNTLGQVFGSESSHYAGGKSPILRRTQRFTFVSAEFTAFGVSQPTIADEMGRSERTVNRRLSNTYRQSIAARYQAELAPLNRAQLAVQTPLSPDMVQFASSESLEPDSCIRAFGQVWKPGCTLYWSGLEVKGQRRLNNQISALQVQGCSSSTYRLELAG